jgi:hypothetical protein
MKSLRVGLRLFLSVLALMCVPSHSLFAQTGTRSIRSWVHCDGKTDDAVGAATAFDAAKDGAFTLVVDCPVFMHIGIDIRRPIYIDNGTTVQFSGNGLFIVDNSDIPAFVIANSVKIRLQGWRIQFTGKLPVAENWTGYVDNGKFIQTREWPSGAFTGRSLSPWMAIHRGMTFRESGPWGGASNTGAIFYIVGSTKDLEVRDMKMFVAPNAKGSEYIPMAFSMTGYFNNNQKDLLKSTPMTADRFSVPSNLTFSDIDLDGYYMGWQGTMQNALIEHVRAHRYGDLQDDAGQESGGASKWFAPPHLFYLNYDPKNTGLENQNIRILDVIDYGIRTGVARDQGGSDNQSGYANSLKIGGINCVVDGYKSYRPDGFADVLTSNGLTIRNVEATYDSSFLNGVYPAIRFPGAPYRNVTLENITLIDKAPVPRETPIWGSAARENSGVVMRNIKVVLNGPVIVPGNPGPPRPGLKAAITPAPAAKPVANVCPTIAGSNNKLDMQYIVGGHVQQCHQQ